MPDVLFSDHSRKCESISTYYFLRILSFKAWDHQTFIRIQGRKRRATGRGRLIRKKVPTYRNKRQTKKGKREGEKSLNHQ